MEHISPEQVIQGLELFNEGFKHARLVIQEMDDEQLIHVYEQAKKLSNISWLVRCLVLGEAKKRAVRGEGTLASLAKEFGIGKRMAEIDVKVYETFIENDEDFEPLLPAVFYQLATRAENPQEAIEYAILQKTAEPSYPASVFAKVVKGEATKEKLPSGPYMLVRLDDEAWRDAVENAKAEGNYQELYGRFRAYSVEGNHCVYVQ